MKRLLALLLLGAALLTACGRPAATSPAAISATPPPTPSPRPTATPAPVNDFTSQDALLLSLSEGGYAHLFLFDPLSLQLIRLTNGPWNDAEPALSPDGRTLAFASDRNNYWDLYLLDLPTGQVRQLTATREYESAPSWSPDGQWLVYEAYAGQNLDLFIINTEDLSQPPIRLTEHPATDFHPAWAPNGRQIAFISTRSGQSDLWIASLDIPGEGRFLQLTNTPNAIEDFPVWNQQDGSLIFSRREIGSGLQTVQRWTPSDQQTESVTNGGRAAWSPEGGRLAVWLEYPNQGYLTSVTTGGKIVLPPISLPGTLRGLIWLPAADWMKSLPAPYRAAAQLTPTPLWSLGLTPVESGPSRWRIVEIPDVEAPYPALHDLVDEAFSALRTRTAAEIGWDALATLESAFTPLTQPLSPGQEEDWLYTGRAFALNRLLSDAGWLVAAREDNLQQTWWRVYLRARAQDGSQGEPLHHLPWDFSARYSLDPRAYDQGGQWMRTAPAGYWVDFTALASDFGWQRLPATANWQTFYSGARFTEFVRTEGQTWEQAMREIYPDIIFVTPTVVIPPTWTPTATPRVWRTATPTQTPSPQPTFTPAQ